MPVLLSTPLGKYQPNELGRYLFIADLLQRACDQLDRRQPVWMPFPGFGYPLVKVILRTARR
jgi:hypothetical protein